MKEKREEIRTHADAFERETELLVEFGYFDLDGNPRKDEAGRKIWDEVQGLLQKERSGKVVPTKNSQIQ